MRLSAAGLLLAALAGCARGAGNPPSHRDAPATRWHYEVTLADDLDTLETTVCFEGSVPSELRAGKDEAKDRLRRARWLKPGAVRRLPVAGGRIQLDARTRDGCVQYEVSLTEGGSLRTAVRRVGDDLLASPSAWLWRPERRAPDATATLTVRAPAGLRALLPWPKVGARHVLDADAFRFESYAAFGRFAVTEVKLDGVEVALALLDGVLTIDREAALRYLHAGVRAVADSAGGFPARRLSVIVLPTSGASEPVPFGMVARGGEASLLLLVSRDASEAALRRDWVLPHELSHLLLPFVERDDAWLSEGFATYYQELLRARSGVQSELEAMRRIAQNLREVRRAPSGRSLVEESARMHLSHAYRQVYWGGAAFWLKADVALRQRTQGHASLDTLTAALRASGAADTVWSARTLLARLDELAGQPLFTAALVEAEQQVMPAFEPTLSALGVRSAPGSIALDDAAELADVRRALFAPRRAQSAR